MMAPSPSNYPLNNDLYRSNNETYNLNDNTHLTNTPLSNWYTETQRSVSNTPMSSELYDSHWKYSSTSLHSTPGMASSSIHSSPGIHSSPDLRSNSIDRYHPMEQISHIYPQDTTQIDNFTRYNDVLPIANHSNLTNHSNHSNHTNHTNYFDNTSQHNLKNHTIYNNYYDRYPSYSSNLYIEKRDYSQSTNIVQPYSNNDNLNNNISLPSVNQLFEETKIHQILPNNGFRKIQNLQYENQIEFNGNRLNEVQKDFIPNLNSQNTQLQNISYKYDKVLLNQNKESAIKNQQMSTQQPIFLNLNKTIESRIVHNDKNNNLSTQNLQNDSQNLNQTIESNNKQLNENYITNNQSSNNENSLKRKREENQNELESKKKSKNILLENDSDSKFKDSVNPTTICNETELKKAISLYYGMELKNNIHDAYIERLFESERKNFSNFLINSDSLTIKFFSERNLKNKFKVVNQYLGTDLIISDEEKQLIKSELSKDTPIAIISKKVIQQIYQGTFTSFMPPDSFYCNETFASILKVKLEDIMSPNFCHKNIGFSRFNSIMQKDSDNVCNVLYIIYSGIKKVEFKLPLEDSLGHIILIDCQIDIGDSFIYLKCKKICSEFDSLVAIDDYTLSDGLVIPPEYFKEVRVLEDILKSPKQNNDSNTPNSLDPFQTLSLPSKIKSVGITTPKSNLNNESQPCNCHRDDCPSKREAESKEKPSAKESLQAFDKLFGDE